MKLLSSIKRVWFEYQCLAKNNHRWWRKPEEDRCDLDYDVGYRVWECPHCKAQLHKPVK